MQGYAVRATAAKIVWMSGLDAVESSWELF